MTSRVYALAKGISSLLPQPDPEYQRMTSEFAPELNREGINILARPSGRMAVRHKQLVLGGKSKIMVEDNRTPAGRISHLVAQVQDLIQRLEEMEASLEALKRHPDNVSPGGGIEVARDNSAGVERSGTAGLP